MGRSLTKDHDGEGEEREEEEGEEEYLHPCKQIKSEEASRRGSSPRQMGHTSISFSLFLSLSLSSSPFLPLSFISWWREDGEEGGEKGEGRGEAPYVVSWMMGNPRALRWALIWWNLPWWGLANINDHFLSSCSFSFSLSFSSFLSFPVAKRKKSVVVSLGRGGGEEGEGGEEKGIAFFFRSW